jgi:hypothetical protein
VFLCKRLNTLARKHKRDKERDHLILNNPIQQQAEKATKKQQKATKKQQTTKTHTKHNHKKPYKATQSTHTNKKQKADTYIDLKQKSS